MASGWKHYHKLLGNRVCYSPRCWRRKHLDISQAVPDLVKRHAAGNIGTVIETATLHIFLFNLVSYFGAFADVSMILSATGVYSFPSANDLFSAVFFSHASDKEEVWKHFR